MLLGCAGSHFADAGSDAGVDAGCEVGPADAACTCCPGPSASATAIHSAIDCITPKFGSLGEALDAGGFVQLKVGCGQIALKYFGPGIYKLPVTYAVFDSASGQEIGATVADDANTPRGGCPGMAHTAGTPTARAGCSDAGWCDVLSDGGYSGCL
jgi:hypothetical protein